MHGVQVERSTPTSTGAHNILGGCIQVRGKVRGAWWVHSWVSEI